MRRLARTSAALFAALALAGTLLVSSAGVVAAGDYGPGAVYQVELTANTGGHDGGGVWLWYALYQTSENGGTGDYRGSDCGHGKGAAADSGDVTWWFDGDSVVIAGTSLNGLGGFPTTVTVPRDYGHYSGTIGSFLTLPGFIPSSAGKAQLQVAP